MQSATALTDLFIKAITDSEILTDSCKAIRAYETKNLPVPIKHIYFSFSSIENRLFFSKDENGNKTEVNSIKIAVNCFIPLNFSPATTYSLVETVMDILLKSNKNIIGFILGRIEYDSDVDAFRINSEIHYQTEKQI